MLQVISKNHFVLPFSLDLGLRNMAGLADTESEVRSV